MSGGIVARVGEGASEVTEATTIGFSLIYAAVAVGLVVFLARTLSRNGQVFLEDTFEREELASSVNQLLVIGFYLLNLGYALLVYRVQSSYPSVIDAVNDLMTNLGVLLVSLGALHLLNMAVLWRIGGAVLKKGRRVRAADPMPPPPRPTFQLQAPYPAWAAETGSGPSTGDDGSDRLG